MSSSRKFLVAAALVVLAGCGTTTHSQLTRCQNEKKTLLTRVVDEQKRVETLTAQNEQLSSRLADSEKQLARLYLQSTGRYMAGSAPANSNTGLAGGSAGLPPGVPPTGGAERPSRLIPLGSPTASSGSTASGRPTFGSSAARPRRETDLNDLSPGQPLLDAPANGRSESGWLPRAGGVSRP